MQRLKNRRVKELFRKERRLDREIRRKWEQHEELVAGATSAGSFRYDQDRVTGSSPDGSKQERIVIRFVELEKEIMMMAEEQEKLIKTIRILISVLPPRERRIMQARHLYHEEVQSIMTRFGISYDTYRTYHSRAMKQMEQTIDGVNEMMKQMEQIIDSVNKI